MDVSALRRLERPKAFVPVLALLILCYPAVVLLDSVGVGGLRGELGFIELAGAACFLAAAMAFGLLAVRSAHGGRSSSGRRTGRLLAIGSLAVLMFVCWGEEISWGQHLIGFETPESLAEVNAQGEFNLHNLRPFHQFRSDGTRKGWLESMSSMNRLFSIFWFVYFVALALADRGFERLRRGLERTGVPVPPLWVGAMFLATYVSYKISYAVADARANGQVLQETKEASYALIYAVFALTWLVAVRRQAKNAHEGQ